MLLQCYFNVTNDVVVRYVIDRGCGIRGGTVTVILDRVVVTCISKMPCPRPWSFSKRQLPKATQTDTFIRSPDTPTRS